MNIVAQQGRDGADRARPGEQGLTLIELIVALLLLGIIFSAAASALINFSRASVNSERRVQSTALMTELHERMQALPWDDAVVYTEEIDVLADVGLLDTVTSPPTWESQELVTADAGCTTLTAPSDPDDVPDGIEATDPAVRVAVDACRSSSIPRTLEIITVDGRNYRVYRAITVAERDGVPGGVVKRFTTVAQWETLGRTLTGVLESERAALSDDLGAPVAGATSFSAFPNSVALDAGGFNEEPFRFQADFPGEDVPTLNDVEVTFTVFDTVGNEQNEVLSLTPEPMNPNRYRVLVPATTYRFPDRTQLPVLTWRVGTDLRSADTPLTFVPPSGGGGPVDPFEGEVLSATVVGANEYIVGRVKSVQNALCSDLVVEAQVANVGPTDVVVLRYNPTGGFQEVAMTQVGGSDVYRHSWSEGDPSEWIPPATAGAVTDDQFTVVVTDGDSGAGARESDPVDAEPKTVFKRTSRNNGQCP